MSNSASKRQCTLKRKLNAMRQRFGTLTTTDFFANPELGEYNKAGDEFSRGSTRHGNKRHAAAKEKVVNRRIQRKRNNREINKQLKDE